MQAVIKYLPVKAPTPAPAPEYSEISGLEALDAQRQAEYAAILQERSEYVVAYLLGGVTVVVAFLIGSNL